MVFSSLGEFSVQEKTNQCMTCHAKGESYYYYRSSDHIKGTIACSDCHKPHADARYDVLRGPVAGARTDALDYRAGQLACLECHDEIRTDANLNERHRIKEGMVKCTDCHDQHGPATRTELGGFKFDVCVECHTDKDGPFVFEHPSLRFEGCTACHSSLHGNVNRHLLSHQNVGELCFSCHVVVPGFHSPPSRFATDANCTNCHAAIHGSNINEYFLR
jgi:DmsE family decaheme c-type cytochrome